MPLAVSLSVQLIIPGAKGLLRKLIPNTIQSEGRAKDLFQQRPANEIITMVTLTMNY